ncbi:MAG: hypothetical protein H7258_07130 [Ferruginibacter sp.]|nr:hypothetical protein [Ferruginibacter sp.]
MKRNNLTPLTDEYLQSLKGMEAAAIDPFFYTRLKGRMQKPEASRSAFKPAWAIVTLSLFLSLNIWMIGNERKINQQVTEKRSAFEFFAETYNLSSDSNY